MSVVLRNERSAGGRRVTVWLLSAITVAAVAAVAVTFYQQLSLTGPYRVEYEGRVVDKLLTLRETELGTRGATGLLVEGADGRRFKVAVNRQLYDRTEVGMWVRSSPRGAELFREKPPAPAAGPSGTGAEHPSVSAPVGR